MGRRAQGPLRGRELVRAERRAGLDEPFRIERQAPGEPLGARLRPRHGEDMADLLFLDRPAATGAPRDALEMTVPFQADDLSARVQVDARSASVGVIRVRA